MADNKVFTVSSPDRALVVSRFVSFCLRLPSYCPTDVQLELSMKNRPKTAQAAAPVSLNILEAENSIL